MKVCGLQFDIQWEDAHANMKRVSKFAKSAKEEGADLLVLPEMFATGFSMDAPRVGPFGDEIEQFLCDLSQRNGLNVLGGFAEREGLSYFNACALYDKSGAKRLHYRKIHPFSLAHEDQYYKSGEKVVTVDLEGVRITPFICYDLRFPEIFRAAAENTDLFCVLANWPTRRRHAWTTLLRARAIENQAFVLGVNRVGTAEGIEHAGNSALIDPLGNELDEAVDVEEFVVGNVSPKLVKENRSQFSFIADRRIEFYRSIL